MFSRIKRSVMKLIMMMGLVAVLTGLLGLSPASAEGTQTGSEITSESSSSASDAATVKSLAHAGGTITAKTVAFVKAKGTPRAQQTNCRTIKKAASYWTSYINSYGKEVWHWKSYPKGKRFCKVGGVMRDPVCHNKVKIGVPKAKKPRGIIITGRIKIIAAFKFVAEAEAKVTASAKATAKAWCQNDWTYAEAYASANAYSYAFARARAVATTRAKAKAAATGAATQLSLSASFRGTVEVDAKAKAKATATADAYAKVTCGEGPPPPPPAENKPPTGEIVQFPAHLFPGGEYRAKVVGSDPEDGGNVTLTYTVTGGATKIVDANHPEICDVEGSQRVCTFWIKAGQTPGTNATLTLTVTDSEGRTFTTSRSWPIVADQF